LEAVVDEEVEEVNSMGDFGMVKEWEFEWWCWWCWWWEGPLPPREMDREWWCVGCGL